MNPLFKPTNSTLRSTFEMVPSLSGAQGKAVNAVADHFIGIGAILIEGGVSEELAYAAIEKLHAASLQVNQALEFGWNGGKTTTRR